MSAGRNDPCPCGSGRKYKKCHLAAETAAAAAATMNRTSPLHELDNRLVDALTFYAAKRFGLQFRDIVEDLSTYPDLMEQFSAPWLVYVCSVEGRPVVDWYLDDRGWSLTRGEREWLERQQASWLSIWEVVAVHRGSSLELRDVFTGQNRTVHEVSASESAEPHLMILARVVDAGSVSLLCGAHSSPLRPLQAERVIEKVRGMLRRKGLVPPDRLRQSRIVWGMLQAWSEEVRVRQTPPQLTNTDGDPLLLTEERWAFDPVTRSEVLERLASLENAEWNEEKSGVFTIVRERNHTVLAHVKAGDAQILASTNSLARADSIRARIQEACGSLVKAGVRSHSDPTSLFERMRDRRDQENRKPSSPTPEEQAMVLAMKEQHYAQWLDDSIPALGGKTPRQAARTKSGRYRLTALLKDIELTESHQPEGTRFDVGELRRALELG